MGSKSPSGWRSEPIRQPWCSCRHGAGPPTGGGSTAARSAGSSRRASCPAMRFRHWCPEGVPGWAAGAWVATWPVGLIVGLAAEWLARSGESLAAAVADLVVGWTLIACGQIATGRRERGRVGLLLTLTGFAWFLATL